MPALLRLAPAAALLLLSPVAAVHAGDAIELSKLPANPIADIVSLPLQFNFDHGLGPDGQGTRLNLNVQPVLPITLNDRWKLISRSVLPLVRTQGLPPGRNANGLGDISQSFFFSPRAATPSGWTWGVGPVLRLPTATDDRLGQQQWALGPTAVALRRSDSGWIVGLLGQQVWSLGGGGTRAPIRQTFLQPFTAKGFAGGRSLSANIEATYDWQRQRWHVPVNVLVGQMIQLDGKRVNLQAGLRYHAASRGPGPDWGARVMVTFLFDDA